MRGAVKRIEREAEFANRQAYNNAALSGAAFAGKLPDFDKAFGGKPKAQAPQSPEVLEANLMALAAAWGAKL